MKNTLDAKDLLLIDLLLGNARQPREIAHEADAIARRRLAWRRTGRGALLAFIALATAHALSGCADLSRAAPLSQTVPASVAAVDLEERVPVPGASLYMLVRGADRERPVLLWLHGGPGDAERPLLRLFNAELEQRFVVAYLDQRGAGRSFDPSANPQDLTIERHLTDLDAVVDWLRGRFESRPVILVGHSWGAALALLYARDHPSKLAAAVGVAPLIATRRAQRSEYDFVRQQASAHQDADVLDELRSIGEPPYRSADQVLAMERLAQRYGAVFRSPPSSALTLLRGVLGGHVTPWELPRFFHANRVSLQAMHQELLDLDLSRSVTKVELPVLFYLGRGDHHVDANIALAYLESLAAPMKRSRWFENSAHNVPFEESDAFNATLISELVALEAAGWMQRGKLP